MRSLKSFVFAGLLCLVAVETSPPVQGASTGAVLAILQSELQRNFQVLTTPRSPSESGGSSRYEVTRIES